MIMEVSIQNAYLFLLKVLQIPVGITLFQVVYLNIFAQIICITSDQLIQQRVPSLFISIGGYWLMRVIKNDSKKLKISRMKMSLPSDSNIVFKLQISTLELLLLPFNILPKNLHNRVERYWKHKYIIGIVWDCKAIFQQQFVIVEWAIVQCRSFSRFDVSQRSNSHKRGFSMREVQYIKLTARIKGVIESIDKGCCKFKCRVGNITDEWFSFFTYFEIILLLYSLQQILMHKAKSHPITVVYTLVEIVQKTRIDIVFVNSSKILFKNILSESFLWQI